MHNKTIAFQGVEGAYSHLACKNMFPNSPTLPCNTFEDAFNAVETGVAEYAMIPIENSSAGRVSDIHRIIPHTKLHIVGEHFQPVSHCLLGVKGAKLADIKHAYSHEQALAQCEKSLKTHNIQAIRWADTAGAAEEIAKLKDNSKAAIASSLAADIYGLDILKDKFEDIHTNTTRFIILSKQKQWAEQGQGCVTSFIFRVRNVPAALYKAMGGFATNGVNMIRLESYIDNNFNTAQFHADILGHPQDSSVKLALEELEFFSDHIKILGVYPKNRSNFYEK